MASRKTINYVKGQLFDVFGKDMLKEKTIINEEGQEFTKLDKKDYDLLNDILSCESEPDWDIKQKTILGFICERFIEAGRTKKQAVKVSTMIADALSPKKDEKNKEVKRN